MVWWIMFNAKENKWSDNHYFKIRELDQLPSLSLNVGTFNVYDMSKTTEYKVVHLNESYINVIDQIGEIFVDKYSDIPSAIKQLGTEFINKNRKYQNQFEQELRNSKDFEKVIFENFEKISFK